MLSEGGAPYPIIFDDTGVRETMELDATLRDADATLEMVDFPASFHLFQ